MSYDTLPKLQESKTEDTTTFPEFGHGTTGTEVALAFSKQIQDKTGVYFVMSLRDV